MQTLREQKKFSEEKEAATASSPFLVNSMKLFILPYFFLCSTPFSFFHHEFHLTVCRFMSNRSPSLARVTEQQQNHTYVENEWLSFKFQQYWELYTLKIFFLQTQGLKIFNIKFIMSRFKAKIKIFIWWRSSWTSGSDFMTHVVTAERTWSYIRSKTPAQSRILEGMSFSLSVG